ncbi:ABC-three component system protein [uncultured Granulicatella sp.]|uniref:ABC-three component system protein n=1 Tax=uncultured Granulicatella sp. TaxID=316089 RepID=UPI0028D493FA|nr:ABC-three component system protein [uncultured Granulicatella sp.]
MSEFTISAYIKILKDGMQDTQENVTRILFDAICLFMSNTVDFSPKFITNLIKRKVEVQNEIKKASADPKIIAKAEDYFDETVFPKINNFLIDDVCHKLTLLYSNDQSVPKTKKDDLDNLLASNDIGKFLCQCFMYALNRDNKFLDQELRIDDIPLLSEVDYQCPLCNSPLIKKIRNMSVKKYEITKIFPDDLSSDEQDLFIANRTPVVHLDSSDNMIALCTDCSETYLLNPELDEYTKLFDLKEYSKKNYQMQMQVSNLNLEDEIQYIINSLYDINSTTGIQDFRMDPLLIRDKIDSSCFILKHTVTSYVLQYYKFIRKLFSELDSFSENRFNIIASEVKLAYETIHPTCSSQEETFTKISEWIMQQLNIPNSKKYHIASDIVVAFFIQNCEVFNEIT